MHSYVPAFGLDARTGTEHAEATAGTMREWQPPMIDTDIIRNRLCGRRCGRWQGGRDHCRDSDDVVDGAAAAQLADQHCCRIILERDDT